MMSKIVNEDLKVKAKAWTFEAKAVVLGQCHDNLASCPRREAKRTTSLVILERRLSRQSTAVGTNNETRTNKRKYKP